MFDEYALNLNESMKNLFSIIFLISLIGSAQAQQESTVKQKFSFELKYAANTDHLGEVAYNPELVLRWKLRSNDYFRVGFWMNQSKEVTQVFKFDFGGVNNGYITNKSSFFSLKPAFDFPFKTSQSLQPYVSLELPVGYFLNTTENQDVLDFEYHFDAHSEIISPTLTFGANLKLGLNALITERIYLGAELGIGAVYVWQLSEKLTYTDDNITRKEETESFGFFNYGMGMTTGVKIGCMF